MSGTSGDGVDASIIRSDGKSNYEGILDEYYEYDKEIYKKNDITKYHGSFICNSISGIEFVSQIGKESLNHIEYLEDLLHKYIYE